MSPFDNLSNLQKNRLFKLLDIQTYTFQKNQDILSILKLENIIGIIISGNAKLVNIDYNGNEIVLETLKKNSIFGTNISAINQKNSELIVNEQVEIALINYDLLFSQKYIQYQYFNIFISNLFKILEMKHKTLNERFRVLSQKTVRDKLLEYFEIQYQKNLSRAIVLPFSLKDLSDYLIVNRTSMFRELKNLKEDQFIKVKGRKITLLYKEHFVLY